MDDDIEAVIDLLGLPGDTIVRPSPYQGTELVYFRNGKYTIITFVCGDLLYTNGKPELPGNWYNQGDSYWFLRLA